MEHVPGVFLSGSTFACNSGCTMLACSPGKQQKAHDRTVFVYSNGPKKNKVPKGTQGVSRY